MTANNAIGIPIKKLITGIVIVHSIKKNVITVTKIVLKNLLVINSKDFKNNSLNVILISERLQTKLVTKKNMIDSKFDIKIKLTIKTSN